MYIYIYCNMSQKLQKYYNFFYYEHNEERIVSTMMQYLNLFLYAYHSLCRTLELSIVGFGLKSLLLKNYNKYLGTIKMMYIFQLHSGFLKSKGNIFKIIVINWKTIIMETLNTYLIQYYYRIILELYGMIIFSKLLYLSSFYF